VLVPGNCIKSPLTQSGDVQFIYLVCKLTNTFTHAFSGFSVLHGGVCAGHLGLDCGGIDFRSIRLLAIVLRVHSHGVAILSESAFYEQDIGPSSHENGKCFWYLFSTQVALKKMINAAHHHCH